jgi:hypothetical protein
MKNRNLHARPPKNMEATTDSPDPLHEQCTGNHGNYRQQTSIIIYDTYVNGYFRHRLHAPVSGPPDSLHGQNRPVK